LFAILLTGIEFHKFAGEHTAVYQDIWKEPLKAATEQRPKF
jgi:hypothetical protein